MVIVEDPEQDPWPTADTLRLGSRVKSWILLDEVALGWEMWRIINGFPLSIPEEYAPGGAKAHDSKKTKPSAKAY